MSTVLLFTFLLLTVPDAALGRNGPVTQEEPLFTNGHKPRRFVRKFMRSCHRYDTNETASLARCFQVRLAVVEYDRHWQQFRAALPACPADYQDARETQRRTTTQRWWKDGVEVVVVLEWSKAKQGGYFLERDHPGATYQIRAEATRYEVWRDGRLEYEAPHEIGWGIQCTYDAEGEFIAEGPSAGTADRKSNSRLLRHMRTDVDWFHVALLLDGGNFNGPHVMAYRELHPVRAERVGTRQGTPVEEEPPPQMISK